MDNYPEFPWMLKGLSVTTVGALLLWMFSSKGPHRCRKSENFCCSHQKHLQTPNFQLICMSGQLPENTICSFMVSLAEENTSLLPIIWHHELPSGAPVSTKPTSAHPTCQDEPSLFHFSFLHCPKAKVNWTCFTFIFYINQRPRWTEHVLLFIFT